MRDLLMFFVIFICFGCHNEVSITSESTLKQANSEIIKVNRMDKNLSFVESKLSDTIINDTIQVIVKITNMLPIGWGTKYKCKIEKIIKGSVAYIDSSFNMYIGMVESDESVDIDKDIDPHFLKYDEYYLIEFIKTEMRTDNSNTTGGVTGMSDKEGLIWGINVLKKIN